MTPLFLFFGLVSTGAGHGDYILATILFPYSTILIFGLGNLSPAFIVIALAIIQFPAYGLTLGVASEKRRLHSWGIALLFVHVLGVVAGLLLRNRLL